MAGQSQVKRGVAKKSKWTHGLEFQYNLNLHHRRRSSFIASFYIASLYRIAFIATFKKYSSTFHTLISIYYLWWSFLSFFLFLCCAWRYDQVKEETDWFAAVILSCAFFKKKRLSHFAFIRKSIYFFSSHWRNYFFRLHKHLTLLFFLSAMASEQVMNLTFHSKRAYKKRKDDCFCLWYSLSYSVFCHPCDHVCIIIRLAFAMSYIAFFSLRRVLLHDQKNVEHHHCRSCGVHNVE